MEQFNMAEHLEQYQKYLEFLAANKRPDIFTNAGMEHASILMAEMFKNSKNKVRIFCKGFKPDLTTKEKYKTALLSYLDKGLPLQILVKDDQYITKSYLKTEKKENYTIEAKRITEEGLQTISEFFSSEVNFAIFDDDKFRLEIDPSKFKAIGSFNDTNKAAILEKMFDDAFNEGTRIEI